MQSAEVSFQNMPRRVKVRREKATWPFLLLEVRQQRSLFTKGGDGIPHKRIDVESGGYAARKKGHTLAVACVSGKALQPSCGGGKGFLQNGGVLRWEE